MMKRLFYIMLSVVLVFMAGACQKETVQDTGITNLSNPIQGKNVPYDGPTITITFNAAAAWTAELSDASEEWVKITRKKGNAAGGDSYVRLDFSKNDTGRERQVILWIQVQGKPDRMEIVLTQAAVPETSLMSQSLNTDMDKILQEKYLWAEEYRSQERDLTVTYDKFLYNHLTSLGDVNIEDGGYYREFSSNFGQRYIYSYIQEVTQTKSVTRTGTLTSTFGLGIGPLFASPTEYDNNAIYLTVGYVYRGSPAEAAELMKGDNIYAVARGNGELVNLTRDNYQQYMKELFSSPSGSYTLLFSRYEMAEDGEHYNLNPNYSVNITASTYGYDPVLFAAIVKNDDVNSSESSDSLPDDLCVGYLALESFDMNAQFVLEDQLQQFADAGIKELILDFSFCVGGVVDQSCYLASSIVGPKHYEDVFFTARFQYRDDENWTFGGNNPNLPDNQRLGVGPDLGLDRVWIIVSENTASAAELIIHALKSRTINFPVTLIGSRTEGKNVGMEVQNLRYGDRVFEFAPITYWGLNADGEKAPADGFILEGDNELNNQNANYKDDKVDIFPYTFGDWGDFNFNVPFYYIFCDIIGWPRPSLNGDNDDEKAEGDNVPTRCLPSSFRRACEPIAFTGVKHEPGRCGTLIYR